MPALSVIMPAYNEVGSIEAAVADVQAWVCPVVPDCEIIIIDDGSTDATPALLREMARNEPRLRVIRQANGGHGAALRRGLDAAKGDTLLLLDSDRQILLDGFAGHWALLHDRDLLAVIGVRWPRHDPFHRLIITRLMRALIFLSFGKAPRDAGVPYKLLRRDAWETVKPLLAADCWIPSVLTAVVLNQRHADRVCEVTVSHVARAKGQSVLKWRRLARFCRHATQEIGQLRHDLR